MTTAPLTPPTPGLTMAKGVKSVTVADGLLGLTDMPCATSRASAGHNLPAAPTVFTVSSTTATQVTVKDAAENPGNALPQAGGRGPSVVAGSGPVLLAAAAALVLGRKGHLAG